MRFLFLFLATLSLAPGAPRIIEDSKLHKAFEMGVGKFAEKCLKRVKSRTSHLQEVGSILHPSPASPAANRGWAEQVAPILEKCIS